MAHDKSSSHDDGAVHVHVASIPQYLAIFGALLFFTVLTVGQSYVDLGKFNLLAVVLIASCKASLVVLFFMHLKNDERFNALAFVGGLLFIGIFFVYTFNDTDHRGEPDGQQNVKILPATGKQAPGGFEHEVVFPPRPAHEGAEHGGAEKAAPEHH